MSEGARAMSEKVQPLHPDRPANSLKRARTRAKDDPRVIAWALVSLTEKGVSYEGSGPPELLALITEAAMRRFCEE